MKYHIKIIISVLLTLAASGCSMFQSQEEATIDPGRVEAFRNLLRDDWKISIVDKKVVVYKIVNDKVYTVDIFNINGN